MDSRLSYSYLPRARTSEERHDRNGNILTLTRLNGTEYAAISMTRTGNRLTTADVSEWDGDDEMEYSIYNYNHNANGAMTFDSMSGISGTVFSWNAAGLLHAFVDVEQDAYLAYGDRLSASTMTLKTDTDNRYRFNGKERHDWAGYPYIDYGARMYNPLIGSWLSPDPLADKYTSTSPYVFCAGDPVNYVDPTGMDRYYVDSLGTVTRIEQSKDVVLISQCGAKTSLKDSTLISKLLTTTDGRSFGRSEDASSAYQLFKFLADNCVVEWSIHFDNSGGATVGTNHNTENAANWSSYGLTERPLRSIHSHPGINPNPVDEISSMGYYIVNPNIIGSTEDL